MRAPPSVRLLGPVGVLVGTALEPLPSDRQRALLALLAVEAGRVVTRTRLWDRLWGEDLPADPAAALRTQLSRLRRALDPAGIAIETTDAGYRLVLDPDDIDVHRFERLVAAAAEGRDAIAPLEEALALWRGDAFADIDAEALAPLAVRLNELRLSARERRARLLLDRGDPDVADLEALLREHPEREEARALLMEALYVSGRHTDALSVYHEWRRHLADELGLTPSPALAALEVAILDHRIAARPSIAHPPTTVVPRPVTSILGRDDDVRAIARGLEDHRVITLLGTGGVGKTRLALEVAGQRAAEGEVVFCDLSVVASSSEVTDIVAAALRTERRQGSDLRDAIAAAVDGRRLLLVLDSCEHVVEGVAVLVEHVLQRSTGPAVLATSRERLAVDGERVHVVEPLATEEVDDPGIALFVERAQAVGARMDPTSDANDIRALCRRLDGLPLSIELAAAHVRSAGVTGLRTLLESAPVGLHGGRRSTPRHQSVDAMVAWSYDRLSVDERRAFDAVAVFAGAFDVDAAATVSGCDRARAAASLARLVDASMLVPIPTSDGARYRLLQTLRDSGLRHLELAGDEHNTRRRHADWAVDMAEEAALEARAPSGRQAVERFAALVADLRVAHAWCVGHDLALAARLSVAAHPFALWHGFDECFGWAEVTAAALAVSPTVDSTAVLTSASIGACRRGDLKAASSMIAMAPERAADVVTPHPASARAELALMRGDLDDAHDSFVVAAAAAGRAGDPLDTAWNLGSAALARAYRDRLDDALELATEVHADAEAAGSLAARAFAEFVLGEVKSRRDPASALAHLERAADLAERAGTTFVNGVAHVSLASLHASAESIEPDAALRLYEHAITRWAGTGAWAPLQVTFRSLALLLTRIGRGADAATLVAAGSSALPLYGADRDLVDALRAELGHELGEAAYADAAAQLRDATAGEAATWALAAIERARGSTRVTTTTRS